MDVNHMQHEDSHCLNASYLGVELLWLYFPGEFAIVPLCAASRNKIEAYYPEGVSPLNAAL